MNLSEQNRNRLSRQREQTCDVGGEWRWVRETRAWGWLDTNWYITEE